MSTEYDIIIIGAGIAGLWLADRLKREGYNLIVIDDKAAGAGQTLASQGMIHGGQKYVISGEASTHAAAIAKMPERWDACFGGWGEVDLTTVSFLSDTQVMWPAGSIVADVAVFTAAQLVNAATKKMDAADYPAPLGAMQAAKKFKGRVYELPEKVLDVKTLITALMTPLKGRLFKGVVTELLPDGQIVISGQIFKAQLVIFAAGTGNEHGLQLLRVREKLTQRRSLRQIMVRWLDDPLFGHGITGHPKPRVTITSHLADKNKGYVWYLGGQVAEESASLDDDSALRFAKKEMQEMFPLIDWETKEWATWTGDRAEPFDEGGRLPPGPHLHQRGNILFAWPVKLTFAPLLADRVMAWLDGKNIRPQSKESPPGLPALELGDAPWDHAVWRQ